MAYNQTDHDLSHDEIQAAQQMLPDSYDFCSCASGKKYKFCCKPIFREIVMAMNEAEEGHAKAGLEWIKKAREVVGETAEILCREAIVYNYTDKQKFRELLKDCLERYPNHPRANYVHGLELKQEGKLQEAAIAYQKAIDSYPKTDHYHLNETYNNLGSVLHDLKDYGAAKAAWEQAVVLLPSDRVAKENLVNCIYADPTVPAHLRVMSPFVRRFFQKLPP